MNPSYSSAPFFSSRGLFWIGTLLCTIAGLGLFALLTR
jgi:hypothetical protein